jgi:hypothetical protein
MCADAVCAEKKQEQYMPGSCFYFSQKAFPNGCQSLGMSISCPRPRGSRFLRSSAVFFVFSKPFFFWFLSRRPSQTLN